MYSVSYHRASSVADAAKLIKKAGDGKYVSGGMTLIPAMKLRLAAPTDLVDLRHVPELKGIKVSGKAVTIGAGTTHAEVAANEKLKAVCPALSHLASMIGDPHVRHMGTIGGSIANNDPAADYPGAVVGLGATIVTDRREISGDDFFLGLFETALEPDEIITAVRFPVPDQAHYIKFRHPASGYAVAGVMVSRTKGKVRVGVTGAGPCAFRASDFEAALEQDFSPQAIASIEISADGLNSDISSSAEYRANLVQVLARRCVTALI